MRLFGQSAGGAGLPHPVAAARLGDYLSLLKPRVMARVGVAAFTGLLLAPPVDPLIGFAPLSAIAAGAAGVP